MSDWLPCPYSDEYTFDVARVRAEWSQLHAVDAEPLPDDEDLLAAWALFHAGHFEQAAEAGLRAGAPGWSLVNRATAAYAMLLEPQEKVRLELLRRVHLQASAQAALRPDLANAWYWQGYALAHCAEGIQVARALAQGLGTPVRMALEATLAIDARHAYAHVALGTFQASVIDRVGPLVGALSYGAQTDAALDHLRQALQLAPHSPAVLMECGNALRLLGGADKLAEAEALHEHAATIEARDAVERLWVELARTV